ncbi:hypothetical protein SAMN05443252_101276 [Bacillus sp. OV322]|nr:hypothetical protein SAMN05443252_101276 [Bacillus sp. OV322]
MKNGLQKRPFFICRFYLLKTDIDFLPLDLLEYTASKVKKKYEIMLIFARIVVLVN